MSYEETVERWDTADAVDGNFVRDTLAAYLREVVATFSRKNPAATVYGIVLVCGQNWELSVYLNTEEGYRTMPRRFRKENERTYGSKTDEEIHSMLGRWYYDAWEFGLYEFKCEPEVKAVNDLHYELFNRLGDAGASLSDMGNHFLAACAGAAAVLEASRELHALQRTSDFEIRLFDANSYEWDTAVFMEQARGERPDA